MTKEEKRIEVEFEKFVAGIPELNWMSLRKDMFAEDEPGYEGAYESGFFEGWRLAKGYKI